MAVNKYCFAYKNINNKHECHALKEIDCIDCPFYQNRAFIKNNPFYAYSYKNEDKFKKDVKRYRIKQEEVLYDICR